MSQSDHTNRWFPAGIASSVGDFCPSPGASQVATIDEAHRGNGLVGPAAVAGPPTAIAYIHCRKRHSKSRRRNESDHHSNESVRPGAGNDVQSALESLQRHERYTRPS